MTTNALAGDRRAEELLAALAEPAGRTLTRCMAGCGRWGPR